MDFLQLSLFDLNALTDPIRVACRRMHSAPPKWELSDHACRHCFGRVLQRRVKSKVVAVRCAECSAEANGGATGLCCCGADYGALDRVLECFKNPQRTRANPHEIMVRERLRDGAERAAV